jgi:hypothetical protein
MTDITERLGPYCSEEEFVRRLWKVLFKSEDHDDDGPFFTIDVECEVLAEYLSKGDDAEVLDAGERLFRVGGLALMKFAYDWVSAPGCLLTYSHNLGKALAPPQIIKAEIERIWLSADSSWDWADLKILLGKNYEVRLS